MFLALALFCLLVAGLAGALLDAVVACSVGRDDFLVTFVRLDATSDAAVVDLFVRFGILRENTERIINNSTTLSSLLHLELSNPTNKPE